MLKNLTHHVLTGTAKENLVKLMQDIKREYKSRRTDTRFNNITANMIHGISTKSTGAYEQSSTVPVVVAGPSGCVAKAHGPIESSTQGRPRRFLEVCENRCTQQTHRGQPILPPDAHMSLRAARFRHIQSQASLIAHYHPHTALFNVTTKSHYVCTYV